MYLLISCLSPSVLVVFRDACIRVGCVVKEEQGSGLGKRRQSFIGCLVAAVVIESRIVER
jgi:hypothetical protein